MSDQGRVRESVLAELKLVRLISVLLIAVHVVASAASVMSEECVGMKPFVPWSVVPA